MINAVGGGGVPSTQGPSYPGTGVDDNSVGVSIWSNPGNITANDGNYATNNVGFSTGGYAGFTDYLKATNFGFSIPGGSTIDGIIVEYRWKCNNSNYIVSQIYGGSGSVKIVKNGSISTTDLADTGLYYVPTSFTNKSYGSPTEKWGETWTTSDINDPTFGVVFNSYCDSGKYNDTLYVDYVTITVHYTT